jgi:hypothetical protein
MCAVGCSNFYAIGLRGEKIGVRDKVVLVMCLVLVRDPSCNRLTQ